MKRAIEYTDGPIDEIRIVRDFLPGPEELVFQEESVQVTLDLSKASLDFFQEEASKHHVEYARIIRRLLDLYVAERRAVSLGEGEGSGDHA